MVFLFGALATYWLWYRQALKHAVVLFVHRITRKLVRKQTEEKKGSALLKRCGVINIPKSFSFCNKRWEKPEMFQPPCISHSSRRDVGRRLECAPWTNRCASPELVAIFFFFFFFCAVRRMEDRRTTKGILRPADVLYTLFSSRPAAFCTYLLIPIDDDEDNGDGGSWLRAEKWVKKEKNWQVE